MTTRFTIRATAALIVAAAAVAVPTLIVVSPAHAHDSIVSSTPSSGEVLSQLPSRFSITTNEPLLTMQNSTSGFAMQIRDSAGQYYGDGCLTVSGPTMSQAAALGPAGAYTVLWQLVSSDGHTASGQYPFTWAPVAGQPVSTGSSIPPDCNGAAAGQAPSPNPTAVVTFSPTSSANLSDVLWIGGAIAAVLLAALVTFLILGRRNSKVG
jgi:methionine-rich copper-binding protein CopC